MTKMPLFASIAPRTTLPLIPLFRPSFNFSRASQNLVPGRVFCKKGCGADGDTWAECVSECDQICYKDPVLKDQQWSAYIDRSPGDASYSEECFHACVAGCGYKFEVPAEKVKECHPNRPCKSPAVPKPAKKFAESQAPVEDNVPGTSA